LPFQSARDIKTIHKNLGYYAAAFAIDTYDSVTQQIRREGAGKMNQPLEKLRAE